MRRRKDAGEFSATGPGLDPPPTYESAGAALSRTQTAALTAHCDGTWYVRNDRDEILGYSIREEGSVSTRRTR